MRIIISILFIINFLYSDTIYLNIKKNFSDLDNMKIEDVEYFGYFKNKLLFKTSISEDVYFIPVNIVSEINNDIEMINFRNPRYLYNQLDFKIVNYLRQKYPKKDIKNPIKHRKKKHKMDINNYLYQEDNKNSGNKSAQSLKKSGRLLIASSFLNVILLAGMSSDKLDEDEVIGGGLITLSLAMAGFIKLIDAGDKLDDYSSHHKHTDHP